MSNGFELTEKQNIIVSALEHYGSKNEFLIMGGSRSGKTFAVLYWFLKRMITYQNARLLFARKHKSDLRDKTINHSLADLIPFVFNGLSITDLEEKNLIKFNKLDLNIRYLPSNSVLEFRGMGSGEIGSDSKLGGSYHAVAIDEIRQVSYDDYQKIITRLDQTIYPVVEYQDKLEPQQPAKFIGMLNPTSKASWVYKKFILNQDPQGRKLKPKENLIFQVNPNDNKFLPKDYTKSLDETLSGRSRLAFLEGQWQEAVDNPLFDISKVKSCQERHNPHFVKRKVIAIDPAGSHKKIMSQTEKEYTPETGIVLVSEFFNTDEQQNEYVIENDFSGNYAPTDWANLVMDLYKKHQVNTIVAETNYGGDLVLQNLNSVLRERNMTAHIMSVRARTSKHARAEPVAQLYSNGRIFHRQTFTNLESQMEQMEIAGWVDKNSSPDRLDAMVYGVLFLADLSISSKGSAVDFRNFYNL